MSNALLEPRKALNKAFLKIKPNRTQIEDFKSNLIAILNAINGKETEEFHKNLVIDFLKKTYYNPHYFVNTKGRNDLVIHNGKDAKTPVGVIIEAKSPSNKTKMISVANLNEKALQEIVLYYLRKRITHKNTDLKHLVVTNIYEWFVFEAQLFNTFFAENKKLGKDFIAFENGSSSSKKTDFFYKEIAKPNKVSPKANKGLFPKILINDARNIPTVEISKPEQQPFIDKVDQILSLKKDHPQADTTALECEIDLMVYALYGVTEEEISIMEES